MKLTRFEELAEKVVPWFIAVCLFVILWAVTGCDYKKAEAVRVNQVLSRWTIIEKGGCEYLVTNNNSDIEIPPVHHAGCKNPIHKCE